MEQPLTPLLSHGSSSGTLTGELIIVSRDPSGDQEGVRQEPEAKGNQKQQTSTENKYGHEPDQAQQQLGYRGSSPAIVEPVAAERADEKPQDIACDHRLLAGFKHHRAARIIAC
jgi:hypothetical protein